ncbi:protoporphyrinogen oxidase [Chitinophaga niastensis]|uniref:Protoporphyrinogen oxidase n=1 Tax=Chitinophaga niastensis TaxID=536980 RepID=A0A2P8HQA3_CHINA|nr:NAD(P)/FAD-dependent oxidoreductase [Chitinophaga niastensis]PSL48364.1 protoporphyrinogen oxidase [Chitinophaga niastensis]
MNKSDIPVNPIPDSVINDNAANGVHSKQPAKQKAIIIGAGPAGLTAAYELLKRTDITPIILEKSGDIGGISKTVNYKGNRIDIGGHRFFSKSDRVMNWWMNIMPIQSTGDDSFTIAYQNKSREIKPNAFHTSSNGASAEDDKVMLVRQRLSRIYFLRKFFTYPIQLSLDTLTKLGIGRTINIMFSYLKAQLFPRKPEKNLEDFMINHFGHTLYALFFKDYTEKVWGIPCNAISAEWGAQRIKGVSISKAIQHAIQTTVNRKKKSNDIGQKGTETSLIEQFLYPKFGPGQLWEEVARQVEEMGGKILMHHDVKRIYTSDENNEVAAIAAINNITGETSLLEGDYFFSTMPVQELIEDMDGTIPDEVKEIARGLQYRDFITVGILLKRMSFQDKTTGEWKPLELKDTWIYIQEKDVKVGRLQLFNNWSPFMVKDPETVWVGMEFFCNKQDEFWNMTDEDIKQLAISELEKIGLASVANVLDATVLRMEKTYPAYFGTYDRFDVIRQFTDRFKNLFLVGRNGMHKYNNSDHSMLTAMVSVDNISAGITEKTNIWSINTEQQYHEEKGTEKSIAGNPASEASAMQNESPKQQPVRNLDFKDFIFKNPTNKWFVWIGIVGLLVQFIVFKFLYPYASFINGDSYVYLETAYHNFDINTYPVGYSKFLRLFSVITKSDTALIAFQYLLLQTSVLAFVFTIFYFYKPAKLTKILLFVFMLFNPVFLYLANYISSDAFFLSLSLIWFTQLLWIIYRPTNLLILLNALVLFAAFTVRYNALYYPLIAGISLLLSRQRILIKMAGIGISIVLIVLFVQYTSNKYYELSGKRQFTPFTGWQMANNAMYAYRYVDSQHVKKAPPKLQQLDKMVRTYFDTTRDVQKHPEETLVASTVYMWDPRSPLQVYMNEQFKKDTSAGPIKRWATVAPLMAEYGSYLIREYPVEFTKHYLLPNALKYYAPPVEFLEQYSTGVDTVQQIAQVWFNYKTNKIKSHFKDFRVRVLDFYPILVGIMNVVFLFSAFSFILLQGYKQYSRLKLALLLVASLWLVNFGFSVFASPIALRFQLFPILVSLSFTFLLVEYLIKAANGFEIDTNKLKAESLVTEAKGVTA